MTDREQQEHHRRHEPRKPRQLREPHLEQGTEPLGVAQALEPTGHPEVDALLTRLTDADALPPEGHLAVYEDVHRGLRSVLAGLDGRTSHDDDRR